MYKRLRAIGASTVQLDDLGVPSGFTVPDVSSKSNQERIRNSKQSPVAMDAAAVDDHSKKVNLLPRFRCEHHTEIECACVCVHFCSSELPRLLVRARLPSVMYGY